MRARPRPPSAIGDDDERREYRRPVCAARAVLRRGDGVALAFDSFVLPVNVLCSAKITIILGDPELGPIFELVANQRGAEAQQVHAPSFPYATTCFLLNTLGK